MAKGFKFTGWVKPQNQSDDVVMTNVTFSGKEAEKLYSVAELATVVKMLDGGAPEIQGITHNCSNTALLDLFGHVDIGDSKDSYFGLPVYKRNYVPLGEIWLQDKDGQVVRKFSLPNSNASTSEASATIKGIKKE